MLGAEKTILLIQRHLDWGPLLPLTRWWDQSQWRWLGHLLPQQGRKPPTLGFLHTWGSERLPGKTPHCNQRKSAGPDLLASRVNRCTGIFLCARRWFAAFPCWSALILPALCEGG